jgi:hypothetical protein
MFKRFQDIVLSLNQKCLSLYGRLTIKNNLIKNIGTAALFLLVLHLCYRHIGVYKYIHERPCSIHASAQCQRASVAQNYYRVNMNFFLPRIQRFVRNDGVTGLEFPIIYYTGAVLYKCFGFNEIYLRLISLLIVSTGILFFFLLTQRFIKNFILSTLVVFSVVLSPVLMFYSPNFMPDAPGLCFTLMGWFYFFIYLETNKKKHLNLFVFFGTMGALIKAVSAMFFLIVLCLLILDKIKKFKNSQGQPIFKDPGLIFTRVSLGLAAVICWYVYARWLSDNYGNQSFAMVTNIVDNANAFNYVLSYIEGWVFQYYAYETYVLLVCALVFIVVAFKWVNKLFFWITLLYFLAGVSYVYLFFYQFAHHDYYFIALMPLPLFLVLTFVDGLKKISGRLALPVLFVFSLIIFFNIKECLVNCKENYTFRYDSRVYLGGDYRPYYDLEPKLRALGISRKEKIVSAFDDSYTNSLYFMNQPGFTIESVYEHDTIQHALNAPGVKYLVVNDSAKFNKVYPNDFTKNIIIIHRGLIVYKIK